MTNQKTTTKEVTIPNGLVPCRLTSKDLQPKDAGVPGASLNDRLLSLLVVHQGQSRIARLPTKGFS